MAKISEAGREILKKWQDMGVIFFYAGDSSPKPCNFTGVPDHYSIPEQPLPQGISRGWLTAAEELGIRVWLDYKTCQYFTPAQPIPKELLEMEEPKKEILIHHIPERQLWLAQREAGTNEQWQERGKEDKCKWRHIHAAIEPAWRPDCEYRVKPKTVKYYFCLCRRKNGDIVTMSRTGIEKLKHAVAVGDATIIGNIEECDVDVYNLGTNIGLDDREQDNRDAKRYRWLKDHGYVNEKNASKAIIGDHKKTKVAFWYWCSPTELDALIDDATLKNIAAEV